MEEHAPAGIGRLAAWIAAAGCAALSLYALSWTQFAIHTTTYRATFLSAALALVFLLFPLRPETARARLEVAAAAAIGIALLAAVSLTTGIRDDAAALAAVAAAALGLAAMPFAGATGGGRIARAADFLFAGLALAAALYLSLEIDAYKNRPTRPSPLELALGSALIVLVLEATRRTVGWILPAITLGFLAYCVFGPFLPEPFDHRGFSLQRIVGQNVLTLEGLYSTPIDVAATFIILFTIYGAVLDRSGAGRFFIDWTFALFGQTPKPSAPGRAVVASGFLLGTVSGSGVATTVTLASIAWPMLQKAGYRPAPAGGLLAAAGIGATLSPPTLGAAAFLIAEYLDTSYLQILIYATIPTLLYYLSCWLMTEGDGRGAAGALADAQTGSAWSLARRQGYHFLSLAAIVACLVAGLTPFMAVFWSIAIAFALSMLRPETRLVATAPFAAGAGVAAALFAADAAGLAEVRPSVAVFAGLLTALAAGMGQYVRNALRSAHSALPPFAAALSDGGRQVLAITATCACAGLIVSVVNLTGLGLTIAGIIVDLGGGSRLAVILMAALAMWLLGTAVPVTASYIIAAVMLAPALVETGVPAIAAHMFLFYYAVLADVSPPTALAPFAAAAITRGDPFATLLHAWKYTLPAFVVPVVFVLTPEGLQLLMITPEGDAPAGLAAWFGILTATIEAGAALAALAFALTGAGFGGSALRPAERAAAGSAGILMLAPGDLPLLLGIALLAGAAASSALRMRRQAPL